MRNKISRYYILYMYVPYLIWLIIFFSLSYLIAQTIFGRKLESFLWVVAIYTVSIGIALSPVSEAIVRFIEGARRLYTKREKEYLNPFLDEIKIALDYKGFGYNKKIGIYIIDDLGINAKAIGSRSIILTQGLINTMDERTLKGIIAHEVGHIVMGHSKIALISRIGNGIFSFIFIVTSTIATVLKAIISEARDNYLFMVIRFIIRIVLNIILFFFVQLGEAIYAIGSRKNEYYADYFAHQLGFGNELIDALYELHSMSMGGKEDLKTRLKSTHPMLPKRIEYLESYGGDE